MTDENREAEAAGPVGAEVERRSIDTVIQGAQGFAWSPRQGVSKLKEAFGGSDQGSEPLRIEIERPSTGAL